MATRPRNTARSLVVALGASLLAVHACTPPPPPPVACGPQQDNITAQFTQIAVSNAALQPPGCEVLSSPDAQISASLGGVANAQFGDSTGDIGNCSFEQLPVASSGLPKTATFATRYPAGALFQMKDGEASCTINGVVMIPLCGNATVDTNGPPTGVVIACNSDPMVSVAVYRGSATLSLDKLPGAPKATVGPNDQVTANLFKAGFTHSVPQFTPQQVSLFDAQLDALSAGVSLTNKNSLLKVPSLSPSSVVIAPSVLESNLGARYGNVALMCKQASSVPVLFFPSVPSASTPRVYGGVCNGKTATVYGVAVYRQIGLGFSGAFFSETGGGMLLRNDSFSPPITLSAGSSLPVFAWNGGIGQFSFRPISELSPKSSTASRDVYVLKFLYELPPDATPRVGFVAVSLFGAPFPVQIQ